MSYMELINHELERSVLGSIINNDMLFPKLMDLLRVEVFDCPVNARLFTCVKEEFFDSGSISRLKILHRFTDVRSSNGEKLKQNFVDICSTAASPMSVREYTKTLVDLQQRRQLKQLCQSALEDLSTEKSSLDLASSILSGATNVVSSVALDNAKTIGSEFEGLYEQARVGVEQTGAKTGLDMLDCAMDGGLQKSRVYSFIAKSKCGKTMLATTISNALCDNKTKHAFICAEMGSREVASRMLGQRVGLPTEAFKRKQEQYVLDKIAKETVKVKDHVIFENEPAIEFDRLKALIEKHVYKNKIEGFILDYYQLVTGQQKHQSHAQHLEDVANWIHRVCKKHNIWCLLLVQANDEGQVLGSRGIDRACDQKYMIERPLDEQGDPKGSDAWLKMKLSRYTKLVNLGSESMPTLQIAYNGTHIEEK